LLLLRLLGFSSPLHEQELLAHVVNALDDLLERLVVALARLLVGVERVERLQQLLGLGPSPLELLLQLHRRPRLLLVSLLHVGRDLFWVSFAHNEQVDKKVE